MATIKSTIMLQDKMSPVFKSIAQSINSTVTAMQNVDRVGERTFKGMSSDVNSAKVAMDNLNSETAQLPGHANRAASALGGLKSPLVEAVVAIQGIKTAVQGLGKVANISDDLTTMKARADLVNQSFGTTVDIQDEAFYASQRARTSYKAMFDMVGKLGVQAKDAFSSPTEIVAFSELMSKAYKTGGTGAQQQADSMLQLTQALASGRLQGEEFRSITESAPLAAQAIAKYTGKAVGELKQMSADGLITSDIITNSLFAYADEIESSFSNFPITFADSMQKIKDYAIRAFEPIAEKFSAMLQTPEFQEFVLRIIDWISRAITKVGEFVDYVITNWDKISSYLIPGLAGLAAAFAGVKLATMLMNRELFLMNLKMLAIAGLVAVAIYAWQNWGAAGKVLAVILGIVATALLICSVAQKAFNTAILACPITWIIVAIVAAIALVIWAMYTWQEETVKVFEFIGGWCGWAVAMWYNMVAAIWNLIAGLIEFFANCWTDPLGSIVRLFTGFADGILLVIKTVASAIDAVFGTQLAQGVQNLRDTIKMWTAENFGEGNVKITRMEEMSGAEAIAKGNGIGGKAGQATVDSLNKMVDAAKKLGEKPKDDDFDKSIYDEKEGHDYDSFIDPEKSVRIAGGDIDSVGKINDDVKITEEDIKLLRDVAATEFVNRYTTMRPEMNISFGDVRETADVNKILETIEVMVEEAYASSLVTA